MPLEIPLDLPGHSFDQQLTDLARWACLSPAPLLAKQSEIREVMQAGNRPKAVKAMLSCLPSEPWPWPAYEAMIQHRMDFQETEPEEEPISADDVREFHTDALTDMAGHLYDKWVTRHFWLFHKQQMDAIKHLRPFWQMSGWCISEVDEAGGPPLRWETHLADDAIWESDRTPWHCKRLHCRCEVQTLSRMEMTRYVDAGCKCDENAPEILRIWKTQNERMG